MHILGDGAKNVAARGRKQVKVNKTIHALPFAPCVKMSSDSSLQSDRGAAKCARKKIPRAAN